MKLKHLIIFVLLCTLKAHAQNATVRNRKDGKRITTPEDGAYDCCHVEALLQKRAGKWMVAEGVAFSTDVWYEGIAKRYPAAQKEIFPKESAALLAQ